MDTNNLEFMSIGGNCADLAFLPSNRNKGPVDNLLSLMGVKSSDVIFKNKFLDEIYNGEYTVNERSPQFEGDSDKEYTFKHYIICHNDPFTEKYKVELQRRINNFLKFYERAILDNNYYFVYSLDYTDTSKYQGNVKDGFYEGVEFLKEKGIFEKTIYVGTRNIKLKNHWNFFFEDVPRIEGLKYVELNDINIYHHGESHQQFLEKISKI